MGDEGGGPSHGVPSPIGHVSVCGIELRTRACPSERGRQPPVLVTTTTVDQNLKSLALALCGVRLHVLLGSLRLRSRPRREPRPWIRTHTILERT